MARSDEADRCGEERVIDTSGSGARPELVLQLGHSEDIRLWDPKTGELLHTLPDTENATSPLAFSPDGAWLATRSNGTDVKLWDPETGALLRTLAGHSGLILDLTFSPDGRYLATAALDGAVKLWDPRTGALLATFVILPPGHPISTATEWITFTPEGDYVCSDSAAPFIRWRLGEELFPAERFEALYHAPAAVGRILQG